MDYKPPPGPPPGYNAYAPPQGPPPSKQNQQQEQPPPYHDWTVIPDTALLPPPPTLSYDSSPTANASLKDGDRAYAWCKANPLWASRPLTPAQYAAVQNGQLNLMRPPERGFIGDLLPQRTPGHWKGRTHANCRDSCILTMLPVYSALHDNPLNSRRPKTIYFELKVLGIGRESRSRSFEEADAGIAIGFAAPPYPTWRMPGWQRGSLAVHGDDGRRYVNDTFGGTDFTSAFQSGETVGIGMRFGVPSKPPGYSQQGAPTLDIEVFFTRNGKNIGGWDLHEQLDERIEGGTIGLEGECDIFAAVGVFGGVDFEVFFGERDWLYRPER